MRIVIEATGPTAHEVRIYDEETGQELQDMGIDVRSILISADRMHRATMEVNLHSLKMVCTGHVRGSRGLAKRLLQEIAETGEAKL